MKAGLIRNEQRFFQDQINAKHGTKFNMPVVSVAFGKSARRGLTDHQGQEVGRPSK
jgi:hypothetical protein